MHYSLHYAFKYSAASSSWFSFAGHQGSSQSDSCTVTGFGSFKLLTCDWLQKWWSHSHAYGVQSSYQSGGYMRYVARGIIH